MILCKASSKKRRLIDSSRKENSLCWVYSNMRTLLSYVIIFSRKILRFCVLYWIFVFENIFTFLKVLKYFPNKYFLNSNHKDVISAGDLKIYMKQILQVLLKIEENLCLKFKFRLWHIVIQKAFIILISNLITFYLMFRKKRPNLSTLGQRIFSFRTNQMDCALFNFKF